MYNNENFGARIRITRAPQLTPPSPATQRTLRHIACQCPMPYMPNALRLIPDVQYLMPNVKYLESNAQYPIPNVQWPIPNSQCLIPNTQCALKNKTNLYSVPPWVHHFYDMIHPHILETMSWAKFWCHQTGMSLATYYFTNSWAIKVQNLPSIDGHIREVVNWPHFSRNAGHK